MILRGHKTVKDRRQTLEKELGVTLKNVGTFSLDQSVASTRNCENMVGVAQIPMGVAGPLRIAKKDYFIPLATTEGALVASVNRGCKAITESGGATVDSYRVGATRGPVFKVHNMSENSKLFTFINSHKNDFNTIAKTTSGHIALTDVDARSVGLYQFVRFTYDTQDAMGLNMVTIATQKIVDFIEMKTGARCLSLAGNFDVDKKPSWLNFTKGRGFEVWADVTIPKKILSSILKTSARNVYETWLAKCMVGSAVSGSMGFNAQYANVIAALFIATGQDPAHVVEGSLGITTCEVVKNDLYISVYLPDLMVGTVGGGTGLATQKEALGIIGVNTSQQFAEIVGAAVLAGEISLLASLSEGTLANAHQVLARGKK
jgi:hydroxymethylglutaryl-CoA reductase (NADPH)